MSTSTRERDFTPEDEIEAKRSHKKAKIGEGFVTEDDADREGALVYVEPDQMDSGLSFKQQSRRIFPAENLLPPSRSLLGEMSRSDFTEGSTHRTVEADVGISEYVSRDISPIHGIIKQRFTDFLVYEVNLDSEVVHVKSLNMPHSELKKEKANAGNDTDGPGNTGKDGLAGLPQHDSDEIVKNVNTKQLPTESTDDPLIPEVHGSSECDNNPWCERFGEVLGSFFSEEALAQLKQMFLEGPEPPLISDNGWAGRQGRAIGTVVGPIMEPQSTDSQRGSKNKHGKRGRGHGRHDHDVGRRAPKSEKLEDLRKVFSNPIESKASRTEFHKHIRDLFGGKLDSETDTASAPNDEGSRIVIKWARRGSGRDTGRSGPRDAGALGKAPRGTYPPYIHFTLQKTNRDTQDSLSHLSRILRVSVKDLSVAGTKDKRGVTVQRVSLKRGGKKVEDVWKLVNGLTGGRRTLEEALTQRGERGVRVADLKYSKASLELGMLKGNAFVITLRGVQAESTEILNKAMNSIKHKGFINYYGMQRFGTASIPTHAIGLALLQCDWQKAVSLILRHRHGEHPDVVAARDAWLEGDLDKALDLLPRRVVAERCILESFKKMGGDTRNAMGALSTIPRNLRLMYVHAYQSYVWNAIVSERIKSHGVEKAVAGDLVFVNEKSEKSDNFHDNEGHVPVDDKGADSDTEVWPESSSRSSRRSRKPYEAPKVKSLAEDDVDQFSIFDVVMPLPGKDVAYPGGALGERYREFLCRDGLDPDNFDRKQKEYNLTGAYRKMLHLPKELSWSVMRYTDPDVPLAQADEDKLLGFDPPVVDENGRFLALQIKLTLGTAAYATMALREVTKTETSSHHQSSLTQSSADQDFRGTGTADIVVTLPKDDESIAN